jgi:tRNA-splicing ligase RtcB
MTEHKYEYIETSNVPVKAWTKGVIFEDEAKKQVYNTASLPFIHKHIAVMPDVHAGKGSTVGSVIPTKGAIIPACVGVDLGCGMMAVRTSLKAEDLPTNLTEMRHKIERAVPHGRSDNGGANDRGAWANPPQSVLTAWQGMSESFEKILAKHPLITRMKKTDERGPKQLGSLGTGNHFIEVCLDQKNDVWVMLHSGSRGIGNSIGSYFINRAKDEMKVHHIHLLDQDLAYLSEGTKNFDDYCEAVEWAQNYALVNREIMMKRTLEAIKDIKGIPGFQARMEAVNCHHNYISKENHFGEDVLVTRKGAVRADKGMMGIIPGSMGAKSFIVRGLGNPDSFNSCSHGAGRKMSRTKAKETFSVEDHRKATEGVECRKDVDVVDETPGAYKDIMDVMEAQSDLVEIVHTLKQILCVKG